MEQITTATEERAVQTQSNVKVGALLSQGVRAVWRTKALWLGMIGLACALIGQKVLLNNKVEAVVPSIRWYAVGIALMLIAWAGTYKNKSCLQSAEPVTGDEHAVSQA